VHFYRLRNTLITQGWNKEMAVETKELRFDTRGEVEIIDITGEVNSKLRES